MEQGEKKKKGIKKEILEFYFQQFGNEREPNLSKKPNVAGRLQVMKGSETLLPPRGTRVWKLGKYEHFKVPNHGSTHLQHFTFSLLPCNF